MSFDEHLRRALGSLADRLQEETKRQLATISDELGDAFDTERTDAVDRAVADTKAAHEETSQARLAAAVAAAEARSSEALTSAQNEAREAGRAEGLEAGRQQGREEGLEEGRANGIEIGRKEGNEQGREAGRKEGLEEGRQEGREQALAELRAGELAANERLIAAVRAIDGGKSLSEILDTLASAAGREARRASVLVIRGGQLRGWRFIGFGALDDRHDLDVPVAGAGVVAEAARTGVAVST